ncbi:MAG: 2-hydroxyacyl-CoA dehydratase [Deltaproteobacteria bacterium]|nr:2-hydroxyacyl-CoA dehydratase [Deltaproteobacteria bacterium]
MNGKNEIKYLPELPSEEKEELQKNFKATVAKTVAGYLEKMGKVPHRPKCMEYFDRMADFFGQREREIREHKKQGGKIIGFACMFAPVELIMAAGALPIRIDSGFYEPSKLGDRIVPVEVCPVIRSTIGIAMANLYPYLELCDALILPNTCDGKTKLSEILSDSFPVWVMNVPRIKDTEPAKKYWLDQVKQMKEKIERLTGKSISRREIRSSIKTTLTATQALRRLQELRKDVPLISGRDAMLVNQVSFFDDIPRWTEKVNELCDELERHAQEKSYVASQDTPRIMLTGSPMVWPDNWKIPTLIEEGKPQGLIVADEMCSSDRVFYDPVGVDEGTESDMLKAIAERYILPCTCPCFTSENGNQDRIDRLQTLIKDFKINGVIYHVIRGCHLYAMEYIRIKRLLDEEKIPIYYLDTEYSREDIGQMKTRIEAFLEMLVTKTDTDDLY